MPRTPRPVFTRCLRWWAVALLVAAVLPIADMRTAATETPSTATTVAALIADINAANTAGGPQTINLAGGTIYTLATEAVPGSASGLPAIMSGVDLTIVGNGAIIQRDMATANLRLFLVNPNGTLRLTALTLRNGQVTGALGTNGSDGTGTSGGAGGSARGGAIYNNGALIVTSDTFVQDGVSGGAGGKGGSGASGAPVGGSGGNGGTGGEAAGGAIYNAGTLTITNSTFVANSATAGSGGNGGAGGMGSSVGSEGYGAEGGNGEGGAIASIASSPQSVTNSTFTAGSAIGGVGGTGLNGSGGTGAGMGGGIFNGGSGIALTNTVLASNNATTGGNCAGISLSDGGYNSEFNPTATCNFLSHAPSGDPKLGALANHGGPTQTVALGSGSAAINSGNPAICAALPVGGVDQRGLSRLTQCSIGAFEPQPAPFPTLGALAPSSGSVTGGARVVLTGTGFAAGATVLFGTTPATIIAVSASAITLTVPEHGAGTVDVTITNPDRQAATISPGYTFGAVTTLPIPQPTASPVVPTPHPLPGAPRPTGVPINNATPIPLPSPR